MLKRFSIPARTAYLALLLSATVFAEDRFLIRVSGDIQQLAQRHGLKVVKALDGSAAGLYVLSAPSRGNWQQTLRALSSQAGVAAVESDQPVKLPGVASTRPLNATVNRFGSPLLDGTQTFYYNSFAAAAYLNQQAGQIINLASAHDLATGEGVRVAIIDTGVDRTHPVLAAAVSDGFDFIHNLTGGQELMDVNQETTPILDQETTPILDQETTPILDGGSAVILRQETTPILDQETTPILDSKSFPAFGHGTMVAGLVHLVAPKARIMPVRVFGANGAATVSQVVAGIYWAVDNGANVINMSFSTSQDSPALAAAIAYASQKGVICVAAAGNDGKATQVWPASYSTNVLGVGSTDISLTRSLFSNYGWPLVALAAPGEANVTLYPNQHYAQVWGTSFSTPLVAGGAALLLNINRSITQSGARVALAHAKYIGQGMGSGELDLYQACIAVSGRK